MASGVLVRADPAVVDEVAASVRTAARRAHQGTECRSDARVWSGPAAEAAADAAERVEDAAALVRDVAAAAAGLLASFAVDVAELAARERALDRDAADMQEANARWVAAGSPGRDPSLDLLLDLRARQQALAAAYEELSGRLAHALDGLRVQIPDRPLGVRDQWEGFRDAVGGNVVGAAALGYGLSVDALVDRQRWWGTVAATAQGVAGMLTDPVQTAKDSIGWDAFAGGHWGEGSGVLVGTLLTRRPGAGGLGHVVEHVAAHGLVKAAHQTLDEALAYVDLSLHEDAIGHTLRRHVEVDDDYIRDRAANGTLMPDGTRGPKPKKAASRFEDRDTAEMAITYALQAKETQLRSFMMTTQQATHIRIPDMDLGPLGRSALVADPNGPLRQARGIHVELRKDGDRLVILTAYPL